MTTCGAEPKKHNQPEEPWWADSRSFRSAQSFAKVQWLICLVEIRSQLIVLHIRGACKPRQPGSGFFVAWCDLICLSEANVVSAGLTTPANESTSGWSNIDLPLSPAHRFQLATSTVCGLQLVMKAAEAVLLGVGSICWAAEAPCGQRG